VRWRQDRAQPPLAQLEHAYRAACDTDDFAGQTRILISITTRYPTRRGAGTTSACE
jgi:hypothetical protein